jgi:predicted nuclease of predicted toxin-antitoxin system
LNKQHEVLGDMGISPLTISFLRTLGHEAVHLHEEGLDTMPDREILAKARGEGCVLLTTDLDFGELVIAGRSALPSVIIFRLQPPMRADKVNRYLERVLSRHEVELHAGAVISVTEGQIRVRGLPIL